MKLQKETIISEEQSIDHGRWYQDACGAAFAMELIGERWTLLVVRELMLGGRRFTDIRASLPGISAKVLTERLDRLGDIGILNKRRLPPPSATQVYELTEWGYGLEPVMQELGRWSVRSPRHDTSLPLSPVSFMLSLRTMIVTEPPRDFAVSVLFQVGRDRLVAKLAQGVLIASMAGDGRPETDLVLEADAVMAFAGVFYGKRPPEECGVRVTGDRALLARFVDLFALPPKLDAPPRS